MNLYTYAGGNPIAFSDPFGLKCDPPRDNDCPPGEVTFLRPTRSMELQHFAKALAANVSGHVVVHSGDRTTVPTGGSTQSEHLTTDINPNARGAIDFHVYNRAGERASDEQVASVAVNSGLAESEGVRLIVHGPGTNTEGPHLHADLRTDIGHRYETGGDYTPFRPSPRVRMRVSARGFSLFEGLP